MHGFILAIFGLLIVVQVQSACIRRQVLDDKIQFVDQNDDMESIREKIRTEMDQYRRLKEMSLKSKSSKATTTTTEASTLSHLLEDTPEEVPEESSSKATTSTSSSTVRHVHLIGHEELSVDVPEEAPGEVLEESENGEEMTTMGFKDLNIFDVPVLCKTGFVLVGTRCRKLAR
ncbi:unnamed protein product [Chironomus riparius]|uniref:Secreted protein n=1 Tax=Chironomus riparius TaxID=315576 RepID=A0A9N9RSZ2_9DIPT|nr:unnamed protein product [Chironomus riparius]